MSTLRQVRCAVYTRKSSEEGLEQAFNSLDAQRQAGLDYIKSQKSQGWIPVTGSYDDGGYSGGSTDRPGLQRLLEDIKRGRVDVVLVYKVDRLSRSLADFARLMALFDEHQVSFVSVTQQFNTTTSMGRLTLNMLLSFAQFEREVAGERIRDKIAATRRKGVWVCGQPPLGYRLPREGDPGFSPGDRVLRVIEPEARLVRAIYSGYLKHGSLVELAARLNAAGHTTKRWTSTRGKEHGGKPISAALLYRILTNPLYTGRIQSTRGKGADQAESYPGQHEPIIDSSTWDKVQARMRSAQPDQRCRWTHTHLLKGKLRTFEGHSMSPGSVQRPGSKRAGNGATRLVRYYVSQKAIKHGHGSCPIKTINAGYMDDLVRGLVLDHLRTAHGLDLRGRDASERDHWVREVLTSAVLAPERLTLELAKDAVAACGQSIREGVVISGAQPPRRRSADDAVPTCPFTPEVEDRGEHTVLTLALTIKRHDGRRVLVSAEGGDLLSTATAEGRPVPREHLVRAVGQAYAWRERLLRTGATVESIAQEAGVTDAHVHSILLLTQLGPAVLRTILGGTLHRRATLADLLATAERLEWSIQAQLLERR